MTRLRPPAARTSTSASPARAAPAPCAGTCPATSSASVPAASAATRTWTAARGGSCRVSAAPLARARRESNAYCTMASMFVCARKGSNEAKILVYVRTLMNAHSMVTRLVASTLFARTYRGATSVSALRSTVATLTISAKYVTISTANVKRLTRLSMATVYYLDVEKATNVVKGRNASSYQTE